MEEIWKNIEGHPNYMISNNGRVKSLARGKVNGGRDRMLSLNPNKKLRYVIVTIDYKKYFVHRLVALHFISNPESKQEVNHIDGNRSNNHISNLEWCTTGEN